MPGTNRAGEEIMNEITPPAGRKNRSLIVIGLFIALVAGALFVPALADGENKYCVNCSEEFTPGSLEWWWCIATHWCYSGSTLATPV
jgi:hypothetical protein